MKRLKNWVKNNIKLIAVMVVGLFISTVTSYGASQLESSSVSYMKKDGQLTTVKSALDELITKSSKVDDLEEKVSDYKKLTIYLVDNAKVGDYVAYDAGDWNQTVGLPAKQGDFGGYKTNTSKNASVVCSGSSATKLNGWRVLKVDKENKIVTLVHAGIPECYYHSFDDSSYPKASVDALNQKANEYINSDYATKAHAMTKEEAYNITGTDIESKDDLRNIGTFYWLADPFIPSNSLMITYPDGHITNGCNAAQGFRPVVELKVNIKTTGKETDEFGQKAWTLVP